MDNGVCSSISSRRLPKSSTKCSMPPMALFDLGITLLELGKPDEAARWLTEAVREDPKRADIHYYLGLALEKQRRLAEAKASLRKAIDLNPWYADARLALSRVYSAQREPRLAQEVLAKAVELNSRLMK